MAWVKWEQVPASFEKDGHALGSLSVFNNALLQKWHWRYVSNGDTCWARLLKSIHMVDSEFDMADGGGEVGCLG